MKFNLPALRKQRKIRRNMISALKIGFGSTLAIGISVLLKLPNPASTGTITLLTLTAHTRRETLQLIIRRLITFALTVGLSILIVPFLRETYFAFAVILFVIVLITEALDWQATLSVNAVIASQFVISHDLSARFILEEFVLLLIGIAIAMLFNLIQPDVSEREALLVRMEAVEEELRQVMYEVYESLVSGKGKGTRKYTLPQLKEELADAIQASYDHEHNSFQEEDHWFTDYFQMRLSQSILLQELYNHTGGICQASPSSELIADYVATLIPQVAAPEKPVVQMKHHEKVRRRVVKDFEKESNFENNAMLLYVLLDLQEYLRLKEEFIDKLTPGELEGYRHFHQSRERDKAWKQKLENQKPQDCLLDQLLESDDDDDL